MSLGIGMGTEMGKGVKIHGPGKPSSVTHTCMSQKILSLSKAEDWPWHESHAEMNMHICTSNIINLT